MTPTQGDVVAQAPVTGVLHGTALTDTLERYLASPRFRSARFEELVLDDDPYRRPVRPDDLGMVDFSGQLARADTARLSGLMAHRILLNVNDSREVMLPRTWTDAKRSAFAEFYDPETVALGELVRPALEHHVFGFARDEAADATGDVPALLAELASERHAAAGELNGLLGMAGRPDDPRGMVAVQLLAQALNAQLRPAARLLPFVPPDVLATLTGPAAHDVAELAGLVAQPHSYLQYYLPSTLALVNHLSACYRPASLFSFAGVVAARALESASVLGAVFGRTGVVEPRVADLLAAVEAMGGAPGVREFGRGLAEHRALLAAHDDERRGHFDWVARMPDFVAKARRLQAAIEEHRIDVDLDTFVESWEECSTTHVHDEDRLLIIESGEMEFWNCVGVRHKYVPGDMAFIPKHSLHGSVVFSGQCVYHQPIITEELDRRFGTAVCP